MGDWTGRHEQLIKNAGELDVGRNGLIMADKP